MAREKPVRTRFPYDEAAGKRGGLRRTMDPRRRRISDAGATLISSSAKSMPASSRAISSSSCALIGAKPARDGALRLLRGDAGLIERGGFDEIANGLGARQIDTAIEKGAESEFAGFGERGRQRERRGQDMSAELPGAPWQEISITSSAV